MHQASLELFDFLYASASTTAKGYNCLHFEKEAGVTRGEAGTEDPAGLSEQNDGNALRVSGCLQITGPPSRRSAFFTRRAKTMVGLWGGFSAQPFLSCTEKRSRDGGLQGDREGRFSCQEK